MMPKLNVEILMKLPLQKRVMLLAGLNVLIVGLMYWFLVGPKYGEVRELEAKVEEVNAKLSENRSIAADVPRYLLEKEEMEKRLHDAVAMLPNDKEIPDLIDGISKAGVQSGLKILLFKPDREVSKGFYAEVPVKMSVEGRFDSLYEFCVKIANLSRIVNIGSMNIVSAGHKNRVPVLKADFVATTFRFIPGAGGQDGKKN
jgi:type IV pilus assembly protein PilO